MIDVRSRLSEWRNAVKWWYAKRYGERPGCEHCGRDANWYTTDRGYLCWSCEGQYGPRNHVAAIRDIKPADYLKDDPGLKV